jgi:hypothetical protein
MVLLEWPSIFGEYPHHFQDPLTQPFVKKHTKVVAVRMPFTVEEDSGTETVMVVVGDSGGW